MPRLMLLRSPASVTSPGVAATFSRDVDVLAKFVESPVLTGEVDDRLKEIIQDVCAHKDAPIVELGTMADHAHQLVVCNPSCPNGWAVPSVRSMLTFGMCDMLQTGGL
jgi:hypothetical protein